MGFSRSSVVANSGHASSPLLSRSAQVARIRANSSRHGIVDRGQRGLSVPLRWRPAHGSLPVVSLQSKSGTSGKCAWVPHASRISAFGHENLAVHTSISEHFMQLPVSQRLKSQCVVMQTRSNTEPPIGALTAPIKITRLQPWRPITAVPVSKAKRPVVQQTPNHSFKRTCLRQSA